jgi:hypothetical protein
LTALPTPEAHPLQAAGCVRRYDQIFFFHAFDQEVKLLTGLVALLIPEAKQPASEIGSMLQQVSGEKHD